MPEITGLELIEHIKENHLSTKIVMMTGCPAIEGSLVKRLGADEYLAKPFKLEVIDAVIDQYKK